MVRGDRVVDEILAYLALGAADRERLVALHPVLAPSFPAIADAFYAVALANARTATILSSSEQVARLRLALIDWMSTGLLGPYDDVFIAKRAQIGRRHVAIGLAQHYMVAALNVIRRAYGDRIVVACPAALEAHAFRNAVDKLLDLELAVILRQYQIDSEERLVSAEQQRRIEQVEAMQTLCAGLAHEVRNPSTPPSSSSSSRSAGCVAPVMIRRSWSRSSWRTTTSSGSRPCWTSSLRSRDRRHSRYGLKTSSPSCAM